LASPQEIIRKATLLARKDWQVYTVAQEQEIYVIFSAAADQIERRVQQMIRAGKVPPFRLFQLHRVITEELTAIRPRLAIKIKAGMSGSVDYGIKTGIISMDKALGSTAKKVQIGSSYIGKDGKVRRYNPVQELYADSRWAKINGAAMDSLLRFKPSGITLSSRIWDITWQTEKILRQQLATSVLIGEGPAVLSRTIRNRLLMPETLRGIAKREYHPGTGIYKSAYKNAMRVTRTEYATAYSEGTRRYAQEKTWIKGYISRVTSDNPAEYDASIDGEYFPKDSEPSPPYHPHCMCYLELVYDEIVPEKDQWADEDQLKGPEHWNKIMNV